VTGQPVAIANQEDTMRMQSKVVAAVVSSAAFVSVNAAISSAGAGVSHRAQHRAHPAARRTGSALLARCRVDKSRAVDGGACEALDASQQGADPNSTPALRALEQQCLAAKAGRPGASSSACDDLDRASGN
jgi:hypothetical protein